MLHVTISYCSPVLVHQNAFMNADFNHIATATQSQHWHSSILDRDYFISSFCPKLYYFCHYIWEQHMHQQLYCGSKNNSPRFFHKCINCTNIWDINISWHV